MEPVPTPGMDWRLVALVVGVLAAIVVVTLFVTRGRDGTDR